MLKITTTVAEDGRLTIAISGWVTKEGCTVIDQILKDAQDQPREIAIDLARVTLLERPAVEYLAQLQSRKIVLVNVPSYVNRWIEELS